MLAEAILLSRFRSWRIFGTGTWSSAQVPSTSRQIKTAFGFLYESAKIAQVPFRELVWVLRHERGEQFGRQHYHWLIGHSSWNPPKSDCFRLNALWDSFPSAGFSRNYQFEPSLNGIEYVTKCLSGLALGARVGQDFYESGKFGRNDTTVTLSNSFGRVVSGRRVSALKYGSLTQ